MTVAKFKSSSTHHDVHLVNLNNKECYALGHGCLFDWQVATTVSLDYHSEPIRIFLQSSTLIQIWSLPVQIKKQIKWLALSCLWWSGLWSLRLPCKLNKCEARDSITHTKSVNAKVKAIILLENQQTDKVSSTWGVISQAGTSSSADWTSSASRLREWPGGITARNK